MTPSGGNHGQGRRILPPYTKDAVPLDGGTISIYCGPRAWQLMRQPVRGRLGELQLRCELVFPADKPANAYRWPVEGLQVCVWGEDAPLDRVGELVMELLHAGAREVWLYDERYEPEPVHFTRQEYLNATARSA